MPKYGPYIRFGKKLYVNYPELKVLGLLLGSSLAAMRPRLRPATSGVLRKERESGAGRGL
ncbi:hypothetical protein Stsp02_06160 [Streptomyces sp. NBRC 14336]|nr:hypothetical protein Stsp02_06160 [Streptomyces sp. NBRC 14336]